MKISYNWLKNYIDLDPVQHTPEVLAQTLPLLGFDIESYERLGPPEMPNVVVGQVTSYRKHPDANRLRCCEVSTDQDGELHQIVCGAKNFNTGDKVMVALPGAVLPDDFKIKKSKIRGQPSEGMLCSAKELHLGQDHDGIMIVDKNAPLGTSINALFTHCDTVFDIEITPNRVDVLSHIGVARELSARFGLPVTYPRLSAGVKNDGESLLTEVKVLAGDLCPYYTALSLQGVKVGPSPEWLKDAIEATGQRSINNIVDVTNYVLHETGQPLHAFDAAKIRGGKLLVRTAQAGESITTLGDVDRELSTSNLVIGDSERALAIAGVIGSVDAEVDEQTTNVVLESAYFTPKSIRATSRALNSSTDSSYRFERGVDPKGITYASLRAADLILEVAGGSIVGNRIEVGSEPSKLTVITLYPKQVREFIGFEVCDRVIQSVLESLNLEVASYMDTEDCARWEVSVPSYRGDLLRPVDLIEEFIRIYGTDKIPDSEVVARGIGRTDDRLYIVNSNVADYLTGQNFNEAFRYSLRDPEEVRYFFGNPSHACLAIDNPLQSDQSHLRPSLIPGLIDVLQLNSARGTEGIRFFERGHVYREVQGQLVELISVGFIMAQESRQQEWLTRESEDFYTSRTICKNILEITGQSTKKISYHPIESCRLWQGGHAAYAGDFGSMGFEVTCGMINIAALKKRWGLTAPVLAGSILMTPQIFKRKTKRKRYKAISNQPTSSKDLALIVDASTLAQQVRSDVYKFAKKSSKGFDCESVRIFDLYQAEDLPKGKKSLALNLSFRALDRTLKDKEVNTAFDAIQQLISEKTNYTIRK
ncbi:MAG: phenylalanine--tRNA ligase subunit beta [Verrucomicrobiota bacterium]|nr:phenylalanine--tRNA ligase subunit beta [Verrucomicrobiota bacterium]